MLKKTIHASPPYGVEGGVRAFFFYKHLNPNGFIQSFIGRLFFITKQINNKTIKNRLTTYDLQLMTYNLQLMTYDYLTYD
jgi:hypothetical protein